MLSLRAKNVLRLICFLVFAIVCFVQCYVIMRNYFSYPVVIDMYDVSPNLITILPGLTLCNNNRLSLRKLLESNETLRRAFNERFPDEDFRHIRTRLEADELTKYRDGILQIFDNLGYDAQAHMDRMTMNESYVSKPDTLFKWIGCARTWTNSIECGHLTQIDSLQDRKCTTILHKGSMFYDQIHKPYLFNSTTISETGQYNYFDAKEVIKIIVDFEPEDYADLKRQIGARLIVHPAEYVGTSVDRDFFLSRGYRYDFHLAREDVLLDGAQKSRCFDYSTNLEAYKEKLEPRMPLYGDTCFQNCVTKNMIYRSNCWPTTMPYYRNDSFDPDKKLRSCIWFREPQYLSIYKEIIRVENLKKMKGKGTNASEFDAAKKQSRIIREGLRVYTKIRRFCWSQCTIGCTITEYKVSVTRSVWPSDVEISLNKTGKEKRNKHCCALVTVKYSHFHYDVQQFIRKYNLIDTIGNLGGLLAVWLGISFVSVYHALQKLVEFCQHRASSSKVHAYHQSSAFAFVDNK